MDEPTPRTRSKKGFSIIILILAVAIVAGYLGYWMGVKGYNIAAPTKTTSNLGLETRGLKLGPESIIRNQQATAVGTITKAENGFITVKADNNESAILKLAPKFMAYVPVASASAGSPKTTQDIRDLKLNQKAVMTLELQGQEYVVSTINYLPN